MTVSIHTMRASSLSERAFPMRLPRLILVAVAAVVSAVSSAEAQSPVRFATEGAFRPWKWTEPDGSLAGFEIELYKDLCRRASLTCTIQAQAIDSIIPALNAGKFDAIIAGMS